MLLIWDIHINSKYKDSIISNIYDFISENASEKNIIFLWDYVYHFSYDRKALLQLFELFINLYKDWKNIYVLAWNHDWINESFVFEEWKRVFDIIHRDLNSNNGWVFFITEPIQFEIEWENVLFLPYNVNIGNNFSWKKYVQWDEYYHIQLIIDQLLKSTNKNEIISGNVNQLLLEKIAENKWKPLKILHHYYFSDTIFPWQKSRFSFKDVALIDKFLDLDNVEFISGHLHQSFSYKNYFCTWSVWSTSPLEINQNKFLYKSSWNKFFWKNININPYYFFDNIQDRLDKELIFQKISETFEQNKQNFVSDKFDINLIGSEQINLSAISLSFNSKDINYDNINDLVEKDIINNLKDIKIKKEIIKSSQVLNMLDSWAKDLQSSISDWKNLLITYIKNKFGSDSDSYIDKLKDMKIL